MSPFFPIFMKRSNTFSTAKPVVVFRSALFLLGQVASTLLIGPIMTLLWLSPFKVRYGAANLWVRLNLWWLKTTCGLRYEVEGRELIPQGQSGLIFCKHQSAFETLVLQVIFPPVVFILKRELLRIPFWGWAMATLQPIAINRSLKSLALKQILRDGEARIRSGRWVVLFPEGTRNTSEAALLPFKSGLYHLSRHSPEVEFVPVWIDNIRRVMPKGELIPVPMICTVSFGEPLVLDAQEGKEAFLQRAQAAVLALRPQESLSC